MALNIDVDLEPFSRINPCGFDDLEVTDLRALGVEARRAAIRATMEARLLNHLGLDARERIGRDDSELPVELREPLGRTHVGP